MPDLRSYAVGLEREIVAPDFAGLGRVATRRARLRVISGLALTTAALVTVGLVLTGGPESDRGSLPAVSPTTGPLSSLSADEIVRLAGEALERVTSDDGVQATLTLHHLCPTAAGVASGEESCRAAYHVTGPGGAQQSYVLTGPDETLGPVAYLGRGEFLVYCTVCGDDTAFYRVSAELDAPRLLPADGAPSRPGPGKTLVPCRGDACIFDRESRQLAHLDLATLPFWVGDLETRSWFGPQRGTAELPTGELYIPADVLLGGGHGSSPALLVTRNETARELIPATTRVRPVPGLTGWVHGSTPNGDCPCVVDPARATISVIDLPPNVTWASTTMDGFWGLRSGGGTDPASTYSAVRIDARGREHTHDLPVGDAAAFVQLAEDGETRAMAFYVIEGDEARLHVSVDAGTTWRVLAVPDAAWDSIQNGYLLPTWATWAPAG